jgi:hypothetical protein
MSDTTDIVGRLKKAAATWDISDLDKLVVEVESEITHLRSALDEEAACHSQTECELLKLKADWSAALTPARSDRVREVLERLKAELLSRWPWGPEALEMWIDRELAALKKGAGK